MKNTKAFTETYIKKHYPTITSIMLDTRLDQMARSRALRVLLTSACKSGDIDAIAKLAEEMYYTTLPLTPYDLAMLLREKVFEIRYSEGCGRNDNRNPADWSHEKNVVGFFVSLYDVACYPEAWKKSPMHYGPLNNLVIRVFFEDGKWHFSIEDGGHRAYNIERLLNGVVLPSAKYDADVSRAEVKRFNDYIANRSIMCKSENDTLMKMLTESVLPVVFVDKTFDSSVRNRTKTHSSKDDIALSYRDNRLWLRMKEAVCGKNPYGRPMAFEGDINGNTIAALFIASKLMHYHSCSKYDGIEYILKNITTAQQCDELANYVADYYFNLFNVPSVTYLKRNKKYYHVYKNQAVIHGIQGAVLSKPTAYGVYRHFGSEYRKAVRERTLLVCDTFGTKSFKDYFEAQYCGYRKKETIPARLLLARDTVAYIKKRNDFVLRHTCDIDVMLTYNNIGNGSGHAGCDKQVYTPLVDCLVNNAWLQYLSDFWANTNKQRTANGKKGQCNV